MKNWEESVKKNGKVIKQLVRKGIPDPLRGMAWQLLSGPLNEGLKKMYPSLITVRTHTDYTNRNADVQTCTLLMVILGGSVSF